MEEAGYVPKRSDEERKALLRTSNGALEYIGAIMRGFADVGAEFGYDIRCNVPILTNQYQGSDLKKWRASLSRKLWHRRVFGKLPDLKPGNEMALWARDHLVYLELAVGTPDKSVFAASCSHL